MGLRPAKCYRDSTRIRAYTRLATAVPGKNYIGTSPGVRTRQFNMGNPIKDFTHLLDLRIGETMHIRDNAMEATRTGVNRFLQKHLGKDGYFMKIRVYPHQILRENKQAQGAGADRIQKGMSHPFGRPIGRAIRVKEGQIIMSVLTDEPKISLAKEGLNRAGPKLGAHTFIIVSTDVASIGTKPKTVKEEVVTPAPGTETATATGEKGKEEAGKKEGTTDAKGSKPAVGGKAPTGGKPAAPGKADASTAKKEDTGKKDAKAKK